MNRNDVIDKIFYMIESEESGEIEEQELNQQYQKNLEVVAQIVYKDENCNIIDEIESRLEDNVYTEIWQNFKDEIKSKTNAYLKTRPVVRMDEAQQIEALEEMFSIKYQEKEGLQYMKEILPYTEAVIFAVGYLFSNCESLIIMQDISNRRFVNIFTEDLKLPKSVIDKLWSLYNDKRDQIEKQILYNHIAYMNTRISELTKQNEKLEEELDYIVYLLSDKKDLKDIDIS